MELVAIGDKIIAKKIDHTVGGLIVPENASSNMAEVVAVGPGQINGGRLWPLTVQPGDKILLHGLVSAFNFEGQEYLSVQQHQIIAVVKVQ